MNPSIRRTENDGIPIEFGRLSSYTWHNQPVVPTADEMPDSFAYPRELPTVATVLDEPKHCGGKRIDGKLPRIGHAQFR
jgi:hypothetical protein